MNDLIKYLLNTGITPKNIYLTGNKYYFPYLAENYDIFQKYPTVNIIFHRIPYQILLTSHNL